MYEAQSYLSKLDKMDVQVCIDSEARKMNGLYSEPTFNSKRNEAAKFDHPVSSKIIFESDVIINQPKALIRFKNSTPERFNQ